MNSLKQNDPYEARVTIEKKLSLKQQDKASTR